MVISTGNNNLNKNNKPIQEMIFLDKLKRIGSGNLDLKFISNKFNKLSRFVTWKPFEYQEFKKNRFLVRVLYPTRYQKRISSFRNQGFT